jgi:hypothetical protein
MTIATVWTTPPKIRPRHAPPTTAAVIRSAVEGNELDDLIAVGLALHLFTELVHREVDLPLTDLHRATTVLTKQLSATLSRHPLDAAFRRVLRLVTDPERPAHPDERTAGELCGPAWPAVRTAAYGRAEQSIRGAHDYGVVPMLRLAATRAAAHRSPWWGTAAWRARLSAYLDTEAPGRFEQLTLGDSPEHAPEDCLLAIVA